jgi:hypothetical protein
MEGKGPPYMKVGKFRKYPEDQFELWLANRPTGGEQVSA